VNIPFTRKLLKTKTNTFISHWRLEPKEEDLARWRKGELVEPKKPIIYYIDPATPKQWRPYLITGINDWQLHLKKRDSKTPLWERMA
jgi:hypothetical protein